MKNVDDFLYAASGVAIWSTVEIGIGITASAAATLRPLFRTFFGGTSSARTGTTPQWQKPGISANSIRSRDKENLPSIDFNVHPETSGVTTVINHDDNQRDFEREAGVQEDGLESSISAVSDASRSRLKDFTHQGGDHIYDITVRKSVEQTCR